MMLLSNEDREKFATYLSNEIDINKKLMEQLKKINCEPMIKELGLRNLACSMVLDMIKNVEVMEITP